MYNALIDRKASLGDVIMTEPFIRALHKSGKYSKIAFAPSNCNDVHQNNPFLVSVRQLKKPIHYFNLNNAYEYKLYMPVVDAYLNKYDYKLEEEEKMPKLYLSEKEINYGKKLLGTGKWAVMDIGYPNGQLIHGPRAFWSFKEWMPIYNALQSKNYKIVYVGNRKDYPIKADLDLRMKTNLRQLFGIVNACDYFVGMDSGPMHVAQALGIKGIAIFNPKHPSSSLLFPGTTITPVHRLHSDKINCEEVIEKIT